MKNKKRTKQKNCFGFCIHSFHNVECGMCCGADLPLSWLLHLLVSLCTTVRMMNFIDVLIVVWQRPNADVDNDAGSLIHDDCLPHSHGTYRCDIYTIYDAIRYDAMRCDNYMSISISGVHFDIELLFHGSCCSARCCCYCCCYNSWLILFTNFVVPLLPVLLSAVSLAVAVTIHVFFILFFFRYVFYAFFFYAFLCFLFFVFVFCLFCLISHARAKGGPKKGRRPSSGLSLEGELLL